MSGGVPNSPELRIETWFLIPMVRNSNRRQHAQHLWGALRQEIYELFKGWLGPYEKGHVLLP